MKKFVSYFVTAILGFVGGIFAPGIRRTTNPVVTYVECRWWHACETVWTVQRRGAGPLGQADVEWIETWHVKPGLVEQDIDEDNVAGGKPNPITLKMNPLKFDECYLIAVAEANVKSNAAYNRPPDRYRYYGKVTKIGFRLERLTGVRMHAQQYDDCKDPVKQDDWKWSAEIQTNPE